MSIEALATLLAALVTGVFVLVQWWLSQRAGAAKRDDEMLHWGGLVIDMMAALENLCAEVSGALPVSEFERLRLDAVAASSALVDRGRLVFPNIQTSRQAVDPDGRAKPTVYKGYRVAILDPPCRFAQLRQRSTPPSTGLTKARRSRRLAAHSRFSA